MTNSTTSELDDLQPLRDIFNARGATYSQLVGSETTIVSISLEDFNKALKSITHLIAKEKIEKLDSLSLAVVEPCEPECSEVRHALHEGSWNAHLAIKSRITQLEQEIKASLSGEDK